MIEERVYYKGKYYRRRPTLSPEEGLEYYNGCLGCAFDDPFGCTEPEANCLSTGCGPTSIFIEVST